MTPVPGERLLRFVGDRIRISAAAVDGKLPVEWKLLLRTNLGRAEAARQEVIDHLGSAEPFAGVSWRDIPMRRETDGWWIDLPLCEVGYFRAKVYALDENGHQQWPEAVDDVGITVHPDAYRTANIVYCAFVRLLGASRFAKTAPTTAHEAQIHALDQQGYTVIPASGTLRDLLHQLPHIVERLGCRIVHLLPINPTPTTYARFGRFGSPYAAQDLTAIDPALITFDRCTTGIDQFREVTFAAHQRGAKIFLDMVINHTGWGSTLQENHPDWFRRDDDGAFKSPGAWGTTWEDLVELDHRRPELWRTLADVFLTWCRRGVDGFRCDAGYMVPLVAWRYIVARVRQEFPDTVFLLEGLGGAWSTTAELLGEGGMQWAYSELFQNFGAKDISAYLDHCQREAQRVGVLVHYSETHDNTRLAARGRAWSLLRNRLSAMVGTCGAFAFTSGVEWLCDEKIDVHELRGLRWGASDQLVDELRQMNTLLAQHPCFFDGARLKRLSAEDSPVYALRRESADGHDRLLVLVNTDSEIKQRWEIEQDVFAQLGSPTIDLVSGTTIRSSERDKKIGFTLEAGAVLCLASSTQPQGMTGDLYRRTRAQAAWAYRMIKQVATVEDIGPCDWRELATHVESGAITFLASLSHLDPKQARRDLVGALKSAQAKGDIPRVVPWNLRDLDRIVPVPSGHWLLVRDQSPFSCVVDRHDGKSPQCETAIAIGDGYFACFPPVRHVGDATITVNHFQAHGKSAAGTLRFLGESPRLVSDELVAGLALFTNGRGGMARIAADFGAIRSKYDCLLGANLHSEVPCDRHVLAKRMRAWLVADGFISPLDRNNLVEFEAGPPGRWVFVANAGNGRTVAIEATLDLMHERNCVVARFKRLAKHPRQEHPLDHKREVRLTLRVDIEDRSYHGETKRTPESQRHFSENTKALADRPGFRFSPASDRRLIVTSDSGRFHVQPEWCEHIGHPIEADRGMVGEGDAYSPGWHEIALDPDDACLLTVAVESDLPPSKAVGRFDSDRLKLERTHGAAAGIAADDLFGRSLAGAVHAFVVRRGEGKTVIAGYPWFLDWGRDSLICCRGLLAAGLHENVIDLLRTFATHEHKGTLPNLFVGEEAQNRDTSDAPLWFGVVCEEAAEVAGKQLYRQKVLRGKRTIGDVLESIAEHYLTGTPNGIRVDRDSGLVWSPSHFTWMDTNHPAGTPREGYPVEIQVLWIRLLRQLGGLNSRHAERWQKLAEQARESFERLFWFEERGHLVDQLTAPPGMTAALATPDHALRCNGLFAISLGLVEGVRARRTVAAAQRYLLVPGAIRSLASLPVSPPLPIAAADGRLLNNPHEPYWGHYQGDEDTRRKPAYHNGTAWTWILPTFCEALALAWNRSEHAVATARSYLGSLDHLLRSGCIGQLPEIVDGDAPHTQRGCDAQAWSVTEALRVWKLLGK